MKKDDTENIEGIDILELEYSAILGEVRERKAAKLKTFQILLALHCILTADNFTIIYGEVEEHAAPAAGGLPGDT